MIRLALAPMVKHWWQVPLYLSGRGADHITHARRGPRRRTRVRLHRTRSVLRTTHGKDCRVTLESRTVASFFHATTVALADLDAHVSILARRVEVAVSIPFAGDEQHRSYDPDAAQRFWIALVHAHRVMSKFRGRFIGMASPVPFFWGGLDVASTRFSGRRAPGGACPTAPSRFRNWPRATR